VGQYATMPVRLTVKGREITGSWGMDVMVAPERQRQGLGEVLFRTWDRNVGASLGLGLSDASYRLFQKLRWPDVGPVPCLIKPLSRRAFRHPRWSVPVNRLISAITFPLVLIVSRTRPLRAEVRMVQRFEEAFTTLWETLAPKFDLAVRRDAAYLNWKFASAPHVRYSIAALMRDGRPAGYAVYRHPRPRHAARRLPGRSRRSRRRPDAPALGRPRGARRRLRQDPLVRHARRLPAHAQEVRLLPGQVDDGVRHQGERDGRPSRLLRAHGQLARHARRLGSGSMTHVSPGRHRH
jgi:hypothetical protein